MSDAQTTIPSWDNTRSRLCQAEPGFYELEPGGALAMPLGEEGWMLELTPDRQASEILPAAGCCQSQKGSHRRWVRRDH